MASGFTCRNIYRTEAERNVLSGCVVLLPGRKFPRALLRAIHPATGRGALPAIPPMNHPDQTARRRAGGRRTLALTIPITALTACAFPTEIPQVDQRWIVPAQSTSISVGSLVPSGVSIVQDSSAFTIAIAPTSVTRALSADCAQCAAANGTTAPKPAFAATVGVNSPLPADIASATLASGTLTLAFRNNYNFDPIRPSATANGYVVTTVSSGATIIGKDSVNGATTALPSGGTLTRDIALAGTLSSGSQITVTVTVSSPAGDPILIDASRTMVVTATPTNLRVPSASVTVANRQVSSSIVASLSDVDETVRTHVTGGALVLDIVNPFTVTGTITVQFSAPGISTITKTISLTSGTTHPSVPLTQAELRSLFGHDVTVSFNGPVSGTAGPVTITPRQAFIVTSRLDVSVHTGG